MYYQVSVTDDNFSESLFNSTETFYTAAVLEFNSPGNKFSSAEQIVDVNLKEYIKWIYNAKEYDVDILVFPEATLNYHGKILINRHFIILISQSFAGLLGDDLKKFAIPLPQETLNNEYEYNCDYSSNAVRHFSIFSDAL